MLNNKMRLRKRSAKKGLREDELIVEKPGEGPFPFRYMDPTFALPLCVPIAVNTHLDAHVFRDGGDMQKFHDSAMARYDFDEVDHQQTDAAPRQPRHWDILTEGFHFCALKEIAFIRPGRKRETFFKLRSLLQIGGKGTCTVEAGGIDMVATLDTLLVGGVESVLIICYGRESHMWGARFLKPSGQWWYHSNHEQGRLTQQVFANEVRDVGDCSAITIKQLLPNAGKTNKKKCLHHAHFNWVLHDRPIK
jgi:hypothetical protein